MEFIGAKLSVRARCTAATFPSRLGELLETREELCSVSVHVNPVLSVVNSDPGAWPDDSVLARLQRRRPGFDPYVQLAVPARRMPTEWPTRFEMLGLDVDDDTDSYLFDYGEMPADLEALRRNDVGLLGEWNDAQAVVECLVAAWNIPEPGRPRVWAVFRPRSR